LDSSDTSKGFFHHAVLHVFANIRERMHARQFAVKVSFVEFYLDNVYDLIENNGSKLEIKETADDGIHIRDAVELPVKSAEELFACVGSTILNRKTE
jgi:ubiquitin C-terminal hydrolase